MHVDISAFECNVTIAKHVRVGQIRVEHRIVNADSGAEEEGAIAEEEQFETRQESCAVVVDPLLAGVSRHDVAARVEDAEAIAVLEYMKRDRRPFRAGDDGKLLIEH